MLTLSTERMKIRLYLEQFPAFEFHHLQMSSAAVKLDICRRSWIIYCFIGSRLTTTQYYVSVWPVKTLRHLQASISAAYKFLDAQIQSRSIPHDRCLLTEHTRSTQQVVQFYCNLVFQGLKEMTNEARYSIHTSNISNTASFGTDCVFAACRFIAMLILMKQHAIFKWISHQFFEHGCILNAVMDIFDSV